jgi:hypothetical protein
MAISLQEPNYLEGSLVNHGGRDNPRYSPYCGKESVATDNLIQQLMKQSAKLVGGTRGQNTQVWI